MKQVVVLAVFAPALFVVHADFYIYLFDNTTQRHLNNIDYGTGVRHMEASKRSPVQFCRFKLVALGQKDERVAVQNNAGTDYFCHVQQGNSSVDENNFIRPDKHPTIDDTCKLKYKLKLDPNNICGTQIALKADNDCYWMVSHENSYIKPLSPSPAYFQMISPHAKGQS